MASRPPTEPPRGMRDILPAEAELRDTAAGTILDRHIEAEPAGACLGPREDLRVGVRDPERVIAPTSLGIEDPRQEAAAPLQARKPRPLNELRDPLQRPAALGVDRRHFAVCAGSALEQPLAGPDVRRRKKGARPP